MNTQAKKIAPLMLLIFFGNAQAKLVNSNVDAFTNESNIGMPAAIGEPSFLAQTAFVSKATDSNGLDIKNSPTSAKVTALTTGVIVANDSTQTREYFNEKRVADADNLIMTSPSRQSS